MAASMIIRASASEMVCSGSFGACARPARVSASVTPSTSIGIARHRVAFMSTSRMISAFARLYRLVVCLPVDGRPVHALVRRFLEVSQIRRRLVLLGRHQEPIRAQHIALLADDDVIVVLGAIVVAPERPLLVRLAAICLADGPRTRQGMVDHRD